VAALSGHHSAQRLIGLSSFSIFGGQAIKKMQKCRNSEKKTEAQRGFGPGLFSGYVFLSGPIKMES
jgi:hypothetical protein